MNSKMIWGMLTFGAFLLTSCKKELQPQETSMIPDSTVAITQSNPTQEVITSMPDPIQEVPTSQPAQATAPGMNPPHGQPNHRCDIAVGAPLSSAPTTPASSQNPTTQPQPQPQPQPQNITPVNNASVKTEPGMNPPHGEPGHVCEIPVGSPLPK